jgi:uncharacterized membrane protein
MTETSLEFAGFEPLWVAVVAVVSLASALYFYIRARRLLTPRRIAALAGLRAAWIVVVLLLFFKPVVRTVRTSIEKLDLAVCLDASSSMGIRDFDNLPSRLARAQGYLKPDSRTGDKLDRFFDTRWIAFDRSPRPLDDTVNVFALNPDGESTDIAAALRAAAGGADPETLRGVVVVTDGNHNAAAGSEVIETARGLGVPVYPVAVGTRLERDASFKDVNILSARSTPDVEVAVNHTFMVEVKLESWGLGQTIAPLVLKESATEGPVKRKDVVLTSAAEPQTVTFEMSHAEEGRYLYTVEVPPQKGETITKNNTATFAVNVTAPKMKVLYVDKARWESKFLAQTFLQDPNAEVVAFKEVSLGQVVKQGRIRDMEVTSIPDDTKGFRQFDVVVVGDVDSDNPLVKGRLEALAGAIEEGTGFIMIGGNNAFAAGGYGRSPLREVLPVTVGPRPGAGDDGQVRDPFDLTLTQQGQAHPIFTGYVDLLTAGGADALPEMQGCVRVGPARAAATVLAVNPEQALEGDRSMPVLSYQRYGKGIVVAFTADSTYRWAFKLRALGRESPYVKFWSQMLRFAARRDVSQGPTKPGVKAYTDSGYYEPGQEVAFTAHVTGLEGQKPKEPAVTVLVSPPGEADAQTFALAVDPTEPSTLRGTFEPPADRPGVYSAAVIASDRGQEVGRQTVKFIVGKPNLEFERLDLDRELLDAMAEASGGAAYSLVDFETLLNELGGAADRQVTRTDFAPWNRPAWLFVLFVGLVTAEWGLRKHWRLV